METVPTLNHWTSLFLLAVAQGFFLVTLLLFRFPKKNKVNVWLILLISAFSLILLNYVGFWSDYAVLVPHFASIWLPLTLTIAPFFYLYLQNVTQSKRSTWKTSLHFIPVFAFIISSTFSISNCVRAQLGHAIYSVCVYLRS